MNREPQPPSEPLHQETERQLSLHLCTPRADGEFMPLVPEILACQARNAAAGAATADVMTPPNRPRAPDLLKAQN